MEFYEEFNKINETHNIDLINEFLENTLESSLKKHDTVTVLKCLNEMIGFYRDIENYKSSAKYAHALINLLAKLELDSNMLFICYINIANSLRANKEYDSAIKYFNKAIELYDKEKLNNLSDLAACYNNMALLYQDIKLDSAIKYFNKALLIIKGLNEPLRLGITYINLGYCYLSKNDLNELKSVLNCANDIFKNYLNDFHYSSLLALNAKYNYLISNNDLAVSYYKQALACYDKFQGRTKTYYELLNEYLILIKKYKNEGFKQLLNVSSDLFNDYFNLFPKELLNKVVIGLFGYGSECNKLDDIYSLDHDYEPGFIILYKDDLEVDNIKKLEEFYNKLPEFYDIYYRRKNARHGVFKYSTYLNSIGIEDPLNVSIDSLNLLTNGKIFYNGFNEFKELRENSLLKYRLESKIKLANLILEINQIMYNLLREKTRKNNLNVKYLESILTDKLVSFYFYLKGIPLIHDKERLKLIDSKHILYKFIKSILNNKYNLIKTKLNDYLINSSYSLNLISKKYSKFIEDYRDEIIYNRNDYQNKINISFKITDIEFEMHKALNAYGGVQECQLNKNYYFIMRLSQHLNMSLEFLNSYLNDLIYAKNNNVSLPFIKYAFMEKSTDKKLYELTKDYLPIIDEKRTKLQEAIISVQLEMLNKYLKKQKNDSKNMRTIYSSSDNLDNASYETYLRGELSSYSENTVVLYGRMISLYSKYKKNFVEEVIKTSKFLYL